MLMPEGISQRNYTLCPAELSHAEEYPKSGHSSTMFVLLQGSNMGVSVKRISSRSQQGLFRGEVLGFAKQIRFTWEDAQNTAFSV